TSQNETASISPNEAATPLTPDPSLPTAPSGEITDCTDTRSNVASRDFIQKVCELVNQERAATGIGSLVLDATLSDVAQMHAEDMVNRSYFSHTTPEGLS